MIELHKRYVSWWAKKLNTSNHGLLWISFSPSYLIRFPENKKFSWADLKKIKQKIKDLNITI